MSLNFNKPRWDKESAYEFTFFGACNQSIRQIDECMYLFLVLQSNLLDEESFKCRTCNSLSNSLCIVVTASKSL